ncbi:MAG: hypothetical protein PHV32_15715 [Eubacteriales bacterium]|nr:hypothetical protein [Eubacteriales bacterium]
MDITQIIYPSKLYIIGKGKDVLEQLKALSLQYKTVKDLIDAKLTQD